MNDALQTRPATPSACGCCACAPCTCLDCQCCDCGDCGCDATAAG